MTYESESGRMMSDLFGYGPPAEIVAAVELERLAEQRIERLVGSRGRRAVRGDSEGGDESHLLPLVFAIGRLVEQLRVFELFCDALKHRDRLAEIHRDWDL